MKFKNKVSLLLARCFVLSDIKLDKLSERRACERESEQIRAYDIFQNKRGGYGQEVPLLVGVL